MNLAQRLARWTVLLSDCTEKERLMILMEKGSHLPPPHAQGEQIAGCVSAAWLQAWNDGGRMRFEGWAESLVIKGYIALLIELFDNLSPEEILDAQGSVRNFLAQTRLSASLVPSRTNTFEKLFEFITRKSRELSR